MTAQVNLLVRGLVTLSSLPMYLLSRKYAFTAAKQVSKYARLRFHKEVENLSTDAELGES